MKPQLTLILLILCLAAGSNDAAAQDVFGQPKEPATPAGYTAVYGAKSWYSNTYKVEAEYRLKRPATRTVSDQPPSLSGVDPFQGKTSSDPPSMEEVTGPTQDTTWTGHWIKVGNKMIPYNENNPYCRIRFATEPDSPFLKHSQEDFDGIAPPYTVSDTAPSLYGATNGTIAPQDEDLILDRDIFADKDLKVVRITFFDDDVTLQRINRIARCINVPAPYTVKPLAKDFPAGSKQSLPQVLQAIEDLEGRKMASRPAFELVPQSAGKRRRIATARVFINKEYPVEEAFISLYGQAAQLETRPAYKHFYLGARAAYRQNWQEAWREFETAHEYAPEDYVLARKVLRLYDPGVDCTIISRAHRDVEACIWYARYLRRVPDWRQFERAWAARARIQELYSKLNEERNQRVLNSHWAAGRMPLKVYFRGQYRPDFDARLKDRFRDCIGRWISCTGGKIDYVEVTDIGKADIVCQWDHQEENFGEGYSKNVVPNVQPRIPPLAVTMTKKSNTPIDGVLCHQYAEITIYARSNGCGTRILDDDEFYKTYLHEIGHALGIHRHLDNCTRNIMYYKATDPRPSISLAPEDIDMINRLYRNHPVNSASLKKFIGDQPLSTASSSSDAHVSPIQSSQAVEQNSFSSEAIGSFQ